MVQLYCLESIIPKVSPSREGGGIFSYINIKGSYN